MNGTFYCDTATSACDEWATLARPAYGGNGDDEVSGIWSVMCSTGFLFLDDGYDGPAGHEGPDVVILVEQAAHVLPMIPRP